MGYFGYYDGKYYKNGEMSIPLTDRAIYFGDGVYDAVLGEAGRFYLLEEHIERFLKNATAIGLSLPYRKGRIQAIVETIADSAHGTQFLYLQATRGSSVREHAPKEENAHLLVTLTPTDAPTSAPLSLIGVEDRRYAMCNLKTLNLLPNVLAARRARDLGADEAVFLYRGTVREGSRSNISIVHDGELYTHPTDEHILPGIMRAQLLRTARRLGIAVHEETFTERELLCAQGVIVSATTKIARIADRYNGAPLPRPSETAQRLVKEMHRGFRAFVQS